MSLNRGTAVVQALSVIGAPSKDALSLLHSIGNPLIVVDQDRKILCVNSAAEKTFRIQLGQKADACLPAVACQMPRQVCDLRTARGVIMRAETTSASLNWGGKECRLIMIHDVSAHLGAFKELNTLCETLESRNASLVAHADRTKKDLDREIQRREKVAGDLACSEERFRLAFEQGPIGKSLLDDSLRFVQVNLAFSEMLGYTRAELLELRITDLIHPEDIDSGIEHCRRAFQRSLPHANLEIRLLSKNGRTLYVNVTSTVLFGRRLSSPIVLFHVENRTEQKQFAERVRSSERLAAIGTLTAGVAHEINNPVGAALLSAESALRLLDQPGQAEGIRHYLENIRDAMLRCGHISHSTLRLSSVPSKDFILCDIRDLVRRSIDHVRLFHPSTVAVFAVDAPQQLLHVRVNELEIELALVNLITNSIQNSPAPVQINVRVEATPEFGARVIIADDGPGMSREQTERLFEPFYTTREKCGGNGIGMSIVQRVVSDHGGSIWIKSAPGTGTQVHITLPPPTIARSA